LYDVRTLNLIDSFDEAQVALNRRPEWSLDND
jgi:hypothetical protein